MIRRGRYNFRQDWRVLHQESIKMVARKNQRMFVVSPFGGLDVEAA
jgi:hypothetical protein